MIDPELAKWWLNAQTDIGTWAERTFPHQTPASILRHLRRELAELSCALVNEDKWDIGVECADMLILLLALCHREGIELASFVERKNHINQHERQWGEPDSDGVVEHVRADEARRADH